MSRQKENGIGWCDYTFNPWIGCTKVSPACDNCYAEVMAKRFFKDAKWGNHARILTREENWNKPLTWNRKAEKEGKRYKVFCGSMCDVFDNHRSVIEPIAKLYGVIDDTSKNLDWILLTKRISNVLNWQGFLYENMISRCYALGITVCNHAEAERDIPKLLRVREEFSLPVKNLLLSIEPMLGAIDLSRWIDQLDWVIAGGETGSSARPMHPDWARSIRDQCQAANVPFFFKQWGKKKAGCLLDGQEWKQFPKTF